MKSIHVEKMKTVLLTLILGKMFAFVDKDLHEIQKRANVLIEMNVRTLNGQPVE